MHCHKTVDALTTDKKVLTEEHKNSPWCLLIPAFTEYLLRLTKMCCKMSIFYFKHATLLTLVKPFFYVSNCMQRNFTIFLGFSVNNFNFHTRISSNVLNAWNLVTGPRIHICLPTSLTVGYQQIPVLLHK